MRGTPRPGRFARSPALALVVSLGAGLAGAWWSTRQAGLPQVPMAASTGKPFVWSDLDGRWGLVYFGYRGCPSACPTALSGLAREIRALGPGAARVQVVMISVDPARDTPARLGAYVRYFHPGFIGVHVPDARDLALVCKAFGAAFAPPASAGGEIEHALDVFLIDPRGRLRGRLSPPFVPGEVAKALRG
ncbi:MAG: SCO family protein [Candidatus Sericytochromatia bacterium]|nr:SCO family protein [Candidatus Sericytochromatia bacterium]